MRVGGDAARRDDGKSRIAIERHPDLFRDRPHRERRVAGGEQGAREFPSRLFKVVKQVDRRGLQPREREIERVARERRGRQFHRRVAPRRACLVPRKRRRVGAGRLFEALGGEFVEGGARRIFEPDQPSDLVERLADRVVAGRADRFPFGMTVHAVDRGMPARESEREEGRLGDGSLSREVGRGDMPLDMIDPDERDPVRPRQPLREIDRDEQRADQPRMVGHGDQPHVGKPDPRARKRLTRDARDDLDVRAARDLGDDAPVEPMHRDLRRDDIRADEKTSADLLRDGGGGLVAGGFKAEYEHS